MLNSRIIFNQIDIINHLQNDMHFLGEIIDLFVNTDGSTRAGPQQLAGDSVSRQGEGLDERRRAHAVARAASHPAAAARAVPARGDPAAAAAVQHGQEHTAFLLRSPVRANAHTDAQARAQPWPAVRAPPPGCR